MKDQFLIVGIGASAGGVAALREFFEHVPPDSEMAYVVILHLSPEYDSHLAEVLQRSTTMPVAQVASGVRVEPGRVYVIPPNQTLSMADGHLALSPVLQLETRRAPVDIFFRTLADAQGPRAVSVVLSGTGADGSMGIKRVKERGGLCLAQDLAEAEHADMPRNSVATGLVDYVLPVGEIPGRIAAYDQIRKLVRISAASTIPPPAEEALRDIFSFLRTQTGHDFSITSGPPSFVGSSGGSWSIPCRSSRRTRRSYTSTRRKRVHC